MDKTAIPISAEEFKVIEMSDGIVIQKKDMLYTLNSTACEILELCDGKLNIQRILDEMKTRYPDKDIEKLIKDFIEQLNVLGLIDLKP